MTVRFKAVTEYTHKYGRQSRRPKNVSPQNRVRWAGLRSDQLGLSREPQFQSKKRVLFHPSQVSGSLQLGRSAGSRRQQHATRPATSSAVGPLVQTSGGEKVETPHAPRPSKPPRTLGTTQTQKEVPLTQVRPSAAPNVQKPQADEINYPLRKKAGMKSHWHRTGCHSSEYQKQFLWKDPVTESPLLNAQQMLYSSNRSIPPYKSNPVDMETEYRKSFKGSPPPRPPRFRRDIELNEVPVFQRENISSGKSKGKNRRGQRISKTCSPNMESSCPDPQPLEQEVRPPRPQKYGSPKAMRKAKTEYSTNFRSPLQYSYKDGVWIQSTTAGEEGHEWYHEVRELREKAEAYRKRAWGTHFSRQHLSQIISEQNCLWEASSGTSSSTPSEEDGHSTGSPVVETLDLASVASVRGSTSPRSSVSSKSNRRSLIEDEGLSKDPTLPAQNKLAWEEELSPCERGLNRIKLKRERQPVEQLRQTDERNVNGHLDNENEQGSEEENENLSQEEGSESSSEEGRLPTPKLKTVPAVHRTHHDRTTPATGGAILVSPPKSKDSLRKTTRSQSPLGKAHSPYKHRSQGSPLRVHNKPSCSSTAGMATVDPLPLREDTWDCPGASPEPRPAHKPHNRANSPWITPSNSPHAHRIQGMLRNPEFQHNEDRQKQIRNVTMSHLPSGQKERSSYRRHRCKPNLGNLGLHRADQFVFPSTDSGVYDNDDRMSQISSRSASSCSMASQVLERAQRRKEEFWGKS